MQMSDGAAGMNMLSQGGQGAQAAQEAQQQAQQAQQQAQQAQQQVQRELQQAQREVQQAQREAQQAQQEAQREAQQAQREAQQAVREAQLELARRVGRSSQGFPPFPPGGPQVPEGAVIISVAFFIMCAVIAIGVPLVRAFTRRMDRRNAAAPGTDPETRDRLERIEQAVDAIAVEVERISEGQRFTTKIMSELRGLPQPDPSAALAERSADRSAVPLSRAREAR